MAVADKPRDDEPKRKAETGINIVYDEKKAEEQRLAEQERLEKETEERRKQAGLD